MEYEFKKGDKIKRVRAGDTSSTREGDTGIVLEDISTNNGGYALNYKLDKNGLETNAYIRNFDLVSSNYKPKVPTHLVVWEEDQDPSRFFTSEQEAKDFVKELSEKDNVKKDSILLVEIKSVRKVTIRKSLTFAQHKI